MRDRSLQKHSERYALSFFFFERAPREKGTAENVGISYDRRPDAGASRARDHEREPRPRAIRLLATRDREVARNDYVYFRVTRGVSSYAVAKNIAAGRARMRGSQR